MTEGAPTPEKTPEQFPTKEGITSAFEHVLQGRAYKELRTKTDEAGISFYEIETNEDDKKVEYLYQKNSYDYTQESLPSTLKFSASIHKTIYDGDMPITGECVANYLNGQWFYTS